MNFLKSLFILTLFFSTSLFFGQNNTWYFGNNAGMDFSSGPPVPLTNGALFAYDCSSSISDSLGNLLFYTNGVTVYNKNHVAMANGTGLLGNNNAGQVAIIVPQPSSPNIYYIFTVDVFIGANGFRYHIVDISLNSGLGGVTSKNNLLFSPSTERIDAIYNSCDNSYWIVTHRWNSNTFSSYKLTSTGLNTTPTNSNIGSVHSGITNNALGQMTISDNGKKIVCATYGADRFELFDYNMNTGVVSNPITISGYTRAWGAAFSPDNSLLYVTQWYGQNITQFNLNAGSPTNIINSATIVGSASGPGTNGYHIGYLELAPDDKIYAAVYNDSFLAVINSPNSLGTACNLVDNGFHLGGKLSHAGLCRTVQNQRHYYSQNICQGDSALIFGNYENTAGKYRDTIKTSLGCDSLVIIDLTIDPNFQIVNSISICQGDSVLLQGGYQNSAGSYFDTLQTINGCDSTIQTNLTLNPVFSSSTNTSICQGDSMFLQGNYQKTPGMYFDTLQSILSCDSIIQINLSINPTYTFSTNTSICQGDSILFQNSYYKNTGVYTVSMNTSFGCDSAFTLNLTTNPIYSISILDTICLGDSLLFENNYFSSSGNYPVTISSSKGCDSIRTLLLTVKPTTSSSTNLSICQGDSIFLQGNYQFTSGIYFDTLQAINGCDSIIQSSLSIIPNITTINNLSICQGDSIFIQGGYQVKSGIYYDTLQAQSTCDSIIQSNLTVNPTYSSVSYDTICNGDSSLFQGTYYYSTGNFQTNYTSSLGCDSTFYLNLTVNSANSISLYDTICNGDSILLFENWYDEEGVYIDTIKSNDGCDSSYYMINVYEVYCGKLIIPNVFSPNGDGKNDLFLVDGNIQELEISIYNRWGELLHNSKGKNAYWDGYTYTGKKASDGTYYYVLNIQYTDETGTQKSEVFTGHLTLTRD